MEFIEIIIRTWRTRLREAKVKPKACLYNISKMAWESGLLLGKIFVSGWQINLCNHPSFNIVTFCDSRSQKAKLFISLLIPLSYFGWGLKYTNKYKNSCLMCGLCDNLCHKGDCVWQKSEITIPLTVFSINIEWQQSCL